MSEPSIRAGILFEPERPEKSAEPDRESAMVEFDWDDANVSHIGLHGISPQEAEQVLCGDPLDLEAQTWSGEERIVQLGETLRGRILLVSSTLRGSSIRVVTAFDAPKKWRLYYLARRADPYG